MAGPVPPGLLSARCSTAAPAVVLVSAAAVMGLGVAIRHTRATGFDRWVDDVAAGVLEPLRPGLEPMTAVAGPVQVLVAAAVLAVACLFLRLLCAAVALTAAPLVALLLTEYVLQPALGRPPVTGAGDAFPSGHATAACGLSWVLLALLVPDTTVRRALPGPVRPVLVLAAVLLPLYVAAALLLLRHHYVTDVLGGAAVASSAVALTLRVVDAGRAVVLRAAG